MSYPKYRFDDDSSAAGRSLSNQKQLDNYSINSSKNEMTDYEKNWQNALSDAEITPPELLWEKIESQLPDEVQIIEKGKNKLFLYFGAAIAVAIIIIISFVGGNYWGSYNYSQTDNSKLGAGNSQTNNNEKLTKVLKSQAETVGLEIVVGEANLSKLTKTDISLTQANIGISNSNITIPPSTIVEEKSVVSEQNDTKPFINNLGAIISNSQLFNKPDFANNEKNTVINDFKAGRNINTDSILLAESQTGQLNNGGEILDFKIKRNEKKGMVQMELPESKSLRKWTLATTFSTNTFNDNIKYNQTINQPTFTMEKTSSPEGVSTTKNIEDETSLAVQTDWTPLLSYSGGIALGYDISKRLTIQTGLQYSYQQTTRRGDFMLEDSSGKLIMLPNKVPYDESQTLELKNKSFAVNQSLQYVGIPVRAIVNVGKGAVRLIASGGVLANLLIKSSDLSNKTSSQDQNIQKLSPSQAKEPNLYAPVHLSALTSVGLEWRIAKKYSLQFEPNFRISLTSLTKSEVASSYPYSMGLSLTLAMNL